VNELWIRFADADFDAFDWWRFAGDSEKPADSGQGRGDELAALEAAAVCRVFVPQTLLLSLTVQLPPRASRQQLQAIGYAIEDQLANDVDDNHFAMGPQQESGAVAVVVIERAVMDRLLERLRSARLRCDFIHAEMLLCPEPGNGVLACLCPSPSGWLLRLSRAEAMALSTEMLSETLSWLVARAGGTSAVACCDGSSAALSGLPDLDCQLVDCRPDRERTKSGINLLQGDYRPGSRWIERLKPWRPVFYLLAIWLLLWLAASVIDRVQMQRELDNLRQQQWALIERYLPGTERRGDPKRLLVERLSSARSQAGKNGAIELIAEYAGIQAEFPKLKARRLLYRDSELLVDLEGPQLKLFESLERKLRQQGVRYRIENLDIGPQKTRARLILGGAS